MLKHMPSTIGAWLGGSFDSDKLVSRAAHGAFIRTFSEKEKQDGVWKAYQGAILEYSRDAILKETAQTLSDERTVSPDEAETKYARVLGSAMMTIANALGKNKYLKVSHVDTELISCLECLAKAEVEKKEDLYTEIYQSERLWALASSSDSFVRRANYRLLSVGLDKVLSLINYQIVTTDLLQKGLIIDQSGSINDYLKVLVNVTVIEPQVWTTFYAGTAKKSADRRFRQFLEKGSQGGPLEVWRHISKLIQKIPMTILRPSENPDVSLVLSALRHGINRREEYRSGLDDAWNAYLHLVDRLRSSLSDKEERANFYEASLFSIMRQYFKPNEITSEWTITVQNPAQYCAKAAALVLDQSLNLLITELEKYSTTLVQDIKTSLPEQSKDHAASQESISEQSQRWYSFQAALLAHNKDASLLSTLTQTSTTELQAAMAALKNRNGKPYSAAAILHNALSYVPETTLRQQDLREDLFEFARTVAPSLMVSPSSSYLFKFIEDMSSVQDVQQIYQDGIETVIAAPTSTGRSKALQTLVSSPWPKSTKASDRLSKVVVDTLQQALDGKDGSWVLVASTVKNVSAPEALVDNVLLGLTEKLSLNDQTSEALRGTETILKQNTPAIRNFITSPNGTTLLSRLLFLSQLPDEDNLRYQAVNLKGAIDAMLSKEKFSHVTTDSMVKIIKSGLTDTSDAALE